MSHTIATILVVSGALVRACVSAGIAKGEMVHVSASLIRAHVSFEALARRWVKEVEAENEPLAEAEHDIEPSAKKAGKIKTVCLTDDEASKATAARTRRLEFTHK